MSIPFKVDFLGKKTPAWLCDLNNSLWNILDGKNFVTEYIPEGNKWIVQTVKLSNELEQEVTTLLKDAVPQNITVEYDPFPLDYTRLAYLESWYGPYIDADVLSEEGTEIFARFQITRNLSGDQKLFGGFWGGLSIWQSLFRENIKGAPQTTTDVYEFYAPGEKKVEGNPYATTGELVNLASGERHFSESFWVSSEAGQTNSAIGLFTIGSYSAGLEFMHLPYLRIFAFHIKKQQQFVRDFIPAVSSDGKPCMFDKISGKPFYKESFYREFIAGIDTLVQLYSLLAKLPDLTGQETGVLTIRLDASLQTDELRAMIDERGEAKNWEITEAEELEV